MEEKDYEDVDGVVNLWIAPTQRLYRRLVKAGLRVAYQPFYVDEKIFAPLNVPREELAGRLGVDNERIKGKKLLASFQRDTEGADLQTPKWFKNPELLVEVADVLSADGDWILLLAGPRRHYVIEQCERRGIQYYFYGAKPIPGIDDYPANINPLRTMALLYNLADCYLISSASEGGPKSVLEAAYTRTLVLSTKVGMASDILDARSIYSSAKEAVSRLRYLHSPHGKEEAESLIAKNFVNAVSLCSYEATRNRWQRIYECL